MPALLISLIFLLYFALLVIWVPLLWPAFRLTGGARIWLLIVTAAGLFALLHEIWMLFGTPTEIWFESLMIGIALACLYVSAAAIMFRAKWRRSAASLALALVLIGGGMAYGWLSIDREFQRFTEIYNARDALMFEAKFRDPDTYESYFGPFNAAPGDHPTGHWQAQDHPCYSRLIINAEGRAWLFYRCDGTECHFGPQGTGMQRIGDGTKRRWEVTLGECMGGNVAVRITEEDADRLSVEIKGQTVVFAKAPPPVNAAPAGVSLVFLGPFADVACQGQHARVRQIWLWQEDGQLYAVGIFSTLLVGERADYVSPVLMGAGVKDGDGWSFQWEQYWRSWKASIALKGTDAILTLERDGHRPERIVLKGKSVFQDEVIDLAPLTTRADWEHWFNIVLVHHYSSADIPPCPPDNAELSGQTP